MTDCTNADIRDQLPDLLHGRLDDVARARVEAHVRTCVDCGQELALLQALRGAAPAPRVDVERIVAALPAPRRGRRWSASAWQIAAAVVFLAVGSSTLVKYVQRSHPGDSTAAATVASRLDSSAGASTQAAATASGDVELNVGYGYGDLTAAQLATLLKDLQDLKAVPMADPEASMPDVTLANGGL